jgi:hypothetical protein
MAELDAALRNALESSIVKARDVSEAAAHTALRALAVHEREPRNHMNDHQRALRRALRTKARQLGDPLERDGDAPMPALERELAYERWHQMLFAAFLTHNHLLHHPTENVPVSLQDCHELATFEGDPDGWHTAARYASHMLPGIFKPTDPLLQVHYAPEDHQTLERILDNIPPPTFTSDDGLGWIYQFWQTKQKKTVNESGRKIGGADIAPVTQLFTEHYMVQFLLHNTLGAWWTARHPNTPLPTTKSYLRTLEDGIPAAGTFDGWPNTAKDITVMDPCCGSGHFLIAAFTLLQRFRMVDENLTEAEAGDAVLRDNLHGLELDPRCTQLAAFNLALHAWKNGGYRPLPAMNIACSGIPAGGPETDWTNLTDDPRAKNALKRLHHLFKHAPDLGSLIDPNRLEEDDPLYTANYTEVETLLERTLAATDQSDPATSIFGDAARGIAHAARLLAGKYTLVTTNVPYLVRGKQSETLRSFLDRSAPLGKADLAAAFVERCRHFSARRGAYALVTPQNWLFLGSYADLRKALLESQRLAFVVRLGAGAFETITGEVVNVALSIVENERPNPSSHWGTIDVSAISGSMGKASTLTSEPVSISSQQATRNNSDGVINLSRASAIETLGDYAVCLQGISTTDYPRFGRAFWEICRVLDGWVLQQGTTSTTAAYAGRQHILDMATLMEKKDELRPAIRGDAAWGKRGIALAQTGDLPATLFTGEVFVNSVPVIVTPDEETRLAVWAFCASSEFAVSVRSINAKHSVDNGYIPKVPFDINTWKEAAAKEFPHGLPKPYSDDPTQWLFHGHPAPSTEPLQVAVARLLDYRWPAENDPDMDLSDEARAWIARSAELNDLADGDGIVCLPPVAGEKPAAERLRALLATAYGSQWSPTTEAALLATVGYDGKTLHDWLTGDFFKQHCKSFNNRPFIWHISDGTKDGFSALVNYHKLNRALLERLIYTYLGSYIRQQQDAAKSNTRGADLKLAKAEELKTKLELILQGEEPYDIFVRWKPHYEQPIGWEPDLNDGVRLNIRPFVEAGILRNKFTINWNKDRGNDPTPNATGATERHNDRHLTIAQKRKARQEASS